MRARVAVGRIGSGLIAATLVVGLAGCGGDDDAAQSTVTTPASSEAAAPEVTDPGPASTVPVTTTATVPTSTTPASTDVTTTEVGTATSVPTFTGDADSVFCGIATTMDAVERDPENPFDSAFYESMITTMRPLYDELVAAAPPEIAAALAVEAATFAELDAVFAAVGYQFLDVELSAIPDSPEIDAAKARVNAYLDQVCGIVRDNESSDPPAIEGTLRDLLVGQFVEGGATPEQAACMVEFVASAPPGSDMELGIAVMATCGFVQPLIDAGFSADEAACAVDFLSTAELAGSEVAMGIALVAACGIVQPLIDAGFSADEAQCVIDTLASTDLDVDDTGALGLSVISACNVTSFFTDRGFTDEQATCMLAELAGVGDLTDDEAVVDSLVEVCVA